MKQRFFNLPGPASDSPKSRGEAAQESHPVQEAISRGAVVSSVGWLAFPVFNARKIHPRCPLLEGGGMEYRRFVHRLVGLSFIYLLVFVAGGLAQNLGSINGRITDASGAAVPNATIEVTSQATQATRTATADSIGVYEFAGLNPGMYTLKVTQQGFNTSVRENVEVLVASASTINVTLAVGMMTQEVVVKGESAPLLNTTDATTGNPFDETQVKDLPFLARNVVNLLSLQPGVVFTGESDTDTLSLGSTAKMDNREGVVNGVRGNQSNITVDGVDSNNWANQGAFSSALPLTLDSVQEVRVTTSNANATDGSASGGQVALVTKSGSNDFHGNVRWYYRTTGFTANSFFNNADDIPRPKLQRNIFGGSLGGRVIKDRLFFFLDNEERRDRSDATQGPQSVPTDALKDGVLIYSCNTPAQCPGGTVQGLTTSHAVPAGAFGLGPADLAKIDPAGIGVNPAMLKYMQLFPSGNVPSAGLDGGLSFTGYRFNAPADLSSNIYIARIDYNITKDGRHSIFVRGNLIGASDTLVPEQFPGQGPAQVLLNNSRGIGVQYIGQFRPTLINTLRYGFTRAGVGFSGVDGQSFAVRDYSSNLNFGARPNATQMPVHEVNDSLTWIRGKHSITFGGLVRFINIDRQDSSAAFASFSANPGTCPNQCADAFQNVTSVLNDPTPVSSQYFTEPFLMLTGSISTVSQTLYSNPHSQTFLPAGTPSLRTTAERDFETYAQDSWRMRPNLTITAGLRYEYAGPPWETNGYEVAPTTDLDQWFFQRITNMNQGIASNVSPLLSWNLAGKANGQNSWYTPDYKNFAPRLAVAWSPTSDHGLLESLFGRPGQTSIRAGFGIYYDRMGEPIAFDSDKFGSPGVSTTVADGTSPYTLATAPRFSGTCSLTGCTGLPPISDFVPIPTSAALPYTPSATFSNFGFFVDPHLRTPYSMGLTLSVQRELPKKMSIEVAYVGTLGRRLMTKVDYGQYLNIRDPKSGQTLWQGEDALNTVIGPNYSKPAIAPTNFAGLANIAPIPFFQNMMPNMPKDVAALTGNPAYASLTPTQAYYAFQLLAVPSGPSWACGVAIADKLAVSGAPGVVSPWNSTVDPKGQGFVVLDQQFTSLGGWTNWGNANYNSMQVSVHKNTGIATFTASYVLSKSIDNASSAENGDVGGDYGSLVGLIQNPFDPGQNRAVSDFDVRHNFNGNMILRLPFGKGQRYASNAGRAVDALIGGWELTTLARWRSGFPLTVGNGFNYPTSWQRNALGSLNGVVTTSLTQNGAGGLPNIFSDPSAVLANNFYFTLPGYGGTRNAIRGPGYFSTDAGIFKSFSMPWAPEKQRLQLRLTAFNVFNNVNFSAGAPWAPGNVSGANGLALDPTSPSTFGQITQTAGPRGGAREMEVAIRYEF
jgi:Carboxypeptidase regulatory-like domain